MFGKFLGKLQLFFSEIKCFTNECFIVDAGVIKYFRKFFANFIENLKIFLDADNMNCSSFFEDFSSDLRVAACYKHKLKRTNLLTQYLLKFISV